MPRIALLASHNVASGIFLPKHLEKLRSLGELVVNPDTVRPTKERMIELIQGAEIAITSWGCSFIDEDALRQAPDLKMVAHAAGSVKPIISDALIERGIRVSSANDALGVGVAETALGLTIAAVKRMWPLSQSTRKGGWEYGKDKIREMYELKIGVVGAGRAGRHYIRLLQQFDVDVLLYDPIVSAAEAASIGTVKVELDQLLAESDVISIHAPSIPETFHMFNATAFKMMKDDCVLINTARGTLINEPDLCEELAKGRFTACLDVTEPEPPMPDHPFRKLDNCILIPHIAGAVNNGLHRLGKFSTDEVARYLSRQPLEGEVDLGSLHVIA
ncbi:hydroxyacid dehydrogenase [Paenibacillus koleovorans]|uniref:hydroxyacid dehydrogenase n=1 Tax=Paenibacillus koleovorans TaxID=121608 RepID=UPI000FD871E4|nr:hydroxyacid dehydrogenase [Paenibacillus koleovorans]